MPTSNGCRTHVEKILKDTEGVKHAAVDLENGKAVIEMDRYIEIREFQKALEKDGGGYTIFVPAEKGNV